MELLSQNLNLTTLLAAGCVFMLRRLMKQFDAVAEHVEELRIEQRALDVRVTELERLTAKG